MPAQISSLELLKTSPIHKEILQQALLESCVPDNINATQFQALIGNLVAQQHLVITSKDAPFANPSHNKPLHIEAIIQDHKIKRILLDDGSGLNLSTYKLIKQLSNFEGLVDTYRKIKIKAYDDAQRVSKGTITLPLQVGLEMVETTCQVLNLDLP